MRALIEAEAGEDRGGACGGCVGADRPQPLVDLGQPMRIGGLGLRQQREALGVALQHGFEQAGLAGRSLLLHLRHAGAGGQPDLPAIDRQIAADRAQQRGFAGAVAADQADAPPRFDRQVGAVEQRAAAEADDEAGDGEQAHGGGFTAPRGRVVGVAPSGGVI